MTKSRRSILPAVEQQLHYRSSTSSLVRRTLFVVSYDSVSTTMSSTTVISADSADSAAADDDDGVFDSDHGPAVGASVA